MEEEREREEPLVFMALLPRPLLRLSAHLIPFNSFLLPQRHFVQTSGKRLNRLASAQYSFLRTGRVGSREKKGIWKKDLSGYDEM